MRSFTLLNMEKTVGRVCLVALVAVGLSGLVALPAVAKLVYTKDSKAPDIKAFQDKLNACRQPQNNTFDRLLTEIEKDPINIVTIWLVRESPVAVVDSLVNEEVDLADLDKLDLKPRGAGDELTTQCQIIAHFLQERYSAWRQADKRLLDNGKTIAWVAPTPPEGPGQQDADIDNTLKTLKYHDANNNKTWDFGEPIYEDLNNNDQVDAGEIRVLDGGGFTTKVRKVEQGSNEIGRLLSLGFGSVKNFGYVDSNGNNEWDEGEPIYLDSAESLPRDFGKVSTASFNRAFIEALATGDQVRKDLGQRAIRPVGFATAGEFLYADNDRSGTISEGDTRLITRSPAYAYINQAILVKTLGGNVFFTWVVAWQTGGRAVKVEKDDPDTSRQLIPLFYFDFDKSNDFSAYQQFVLGVGNVEILEPVYDDRDKNGKVSFRDIRVNSAPWPDLLVGTVEDKQADVGRPLLRSPFGFDDTNNNGTWDWTLDEEPLYEDVNKNGKVDPRDRRVAGSWIWVPYIARTFPNLAGLTHRRGYEPGSSVQTGQLDVNKPLTEGRWAYHDVDNNGQWSSGETIYRRAKAVGPWPRGGVAVGDTRISERFRALWPVLEGEPDNTRPLISLYFEDLNGNRRWDQGEPRYADDDRNKQVSANDDRLDVRFIKGTMVVKGDPDLGKDLKNSPYGYDDVNNSGSWDGEQQAGSINYCFLQQDGTCDPKKWFSETWYLENNNIIKRVKTP